jgi:hypothetical protein
MGKDQLLSEMDKGRIAFNAGRGLTACPHPENSPKGEAWRCGWNNARMMQTIREAQRRHHP